MSEDSQLVKYFAECPNCGELQQVSGQGTLNTEFIYSLVICQNCFQSFVTAIPETVSVFAKAAPVKFDVGTLELVK
ncbi:MAG: hypothetical protein KME67_03985 [Candidatus Thiodiazotropha sp. (ex Codakia orbicularis)]|nr:hypothetical protein [Candidatus Thiodiazotropha sp. (ex Codakia orbicularis)]